MTTMSWGFPIRDDLYRRTEAVIAQVEAEEGGAKRLNRAFAEIVHGLLQEGLQAYLQKPSAMISMGSAKRSAIDKGSKVITGAIKVVINQFFGSLDIEKLQAVARYVDDLIWPPAPGEPSRLMFELDPALYEALREHLVSVRSGDAGEQKTEALTQRLQEIVDACIDHYYRQPADLVELKGLSRSVTGFGISNVEKAFDALLERLLARLDPEDLVQLAVYLESLLRRPVEQPVAG